ncbi:uncharacterized protein [Nicotiana sylvestris]|uniref:uncharacterized protein n=1 Tax=Nicotiana sylvestris TaxID=4096 RepID=UPI00388CD140
MSESTTRKLITRDVPTKILNFDGPSFSLQITQGKLDAGLAKNMALEKRTKARHKNLKETQVEKSMKETRMAKTEKRKIHISEASSVKGKEVEASKSSDKVEEKQIFARHISVYTNTDIVSELKENLTPEQYKQEFTLVTDLKCVGNDDDFEFSEKVPNWLIEIYFGGANLVKKKHLMKCFADKNWGPDNDGDALKISLLYFIHTFHFSSEKNSTTIPRLHFDLVESGCYSEYHWGLKVFETLTKWINKKMDAKKKYYRIAGMPLAMQKYTVAYRYIFDALIPAVILAVVSAIIFVVIFSHIVYKDIHPSDIELAVIQIPPVGVDVENKPTPAYSDKSGEDSDDFSPTPDLQCKKKHVANVGPSLSPPHKKRKEHERHPNEIEYQSKIPHKPVLNAQCVESRGEENTTSEVSCNLPSTGQDGISTEFYISQFELDDKFLPSQIPETRLVIYNSAKKMNQPQYHLIGIGDQVDGPHPTLIIQEYDKWVRDGLLIRHDQRSNLEDHYKKNKSTLHIPLDFGVDQVNSKNWFYLLSFDGKLWDDNHIDVIFYYLRKKGKYNQTSNFKYTTVDCIFKTRIAKIFNRYADTDSNANVAKEEDVVCEYIRYYRLLANVPWHTVDNVLIPVNLKDKLHWVLVLSHSRRDVSKLAFTEIVKAYIGLLTQHTLTSHIMIPLKFSHIRSASTEIWEHGLWGACWAYAEFLSTIGEIPQTTFDSNLLRQRYGALLWEYAMRKIDVDAISENEAPSKIARQITESDSKM